VRPAQEMSLAVIRSRAEEAENGCWNWTMYRNPHGYGKVGWRGKVWLAHRLAFAFSAGIDPATMLDDVLHSCDNPACVNPAHLRLGTARENHEDSVARKRAVVGLRGEEHRGARLTENDARAILAARAAGETGESIARRFGVSGTTVCKLWARDST